MAQTASPPAHAPAPVALAAVEPESARRPLISCYTFLSGDDHTPSGYTLHLPIRDYCADDETVRARVATLLQCQGTDPAPLGFGAFAATPSCCAS